MSDIVICSNPECQTTAGCLCGQGTKIYSGPGRVFVSEIVRIDPRDAEITSLRSQLEEARAKAIEECATKLDEMARELTAIAVKHLEIREGPAFQDNATASYSGSHHLGIAAKAIRYLLHGSTK